MEKKIVEFSPMRYISPDELQATELGGHLAFAKSKTGGLIFPTSMTSSSIVKSQNLSKLTVDTLVEKQKNSELKKKEFVVVFKIKITER